MSDLMNDFFKVSVDEINSAVNDGKLVIKKDANYNFQIIEIKEKDMSDYKMMIIVLKEQASGLEHAMFIKNNSKPSIKEYISLIRCFMSDEKISQGFQRTELLGKKFSSTGTSRDWNGKEYTGITNLKRIDDGIVGQAEKSFGGTAIPF